MVLRAAGRGGIVGGVESLDAMEVLVTMNVEVPWENGKYGARVAQSRRPNSTLKVLSRHRQLISTVRDRLTHDVVICTNHCCKGDLGSTASCSLARFHPPWLIANTSHGCCSSRSSLVFTMRVRLIKLRRLTGFKKITSIPSLREKRGKALLAGNSVGFVPTMGALHQGHLALIRQAASENDHVYVSIYVNPTQFGANEDLSSYPRTWDADKVKLAALAKEFKKNDRVGDMSVVFMPSTKEMYPASPPSSEVDGQGSFVTITPLSSKLEGASRPVFFRGVATVCMKLLNIVQPERVYFGQKDIQQTFVIKRMVQDFHLNTEVRVGSTIREQDGLAMSSRNVYLGERRRKVALVLLDSFKEVQKVFARGARKRRFLYNAAVDMLSAVKKQQYALPREKRVRFEIDYVSIADPDTLDELEEVDSERGAILSGAIKMLPTEEPQEREETGLGGGTSTVRLIDNIYLELLSAKVGYIP